MMYKQKKQWKETRRNNAKQRNILQDKYRIILRAIREHDVSRALSTLNQLPCPNSDFAMTKDAYRQTWFSLPGENAYEQILYSAESEKQYKVVARMLDFDCTTKEYIYKNLITSSAEISPNYYIENRRAKPDLFAIYRHQFVVELVIVLNGWTRCLLPPEVLFRILQYIPRIAVPKDSAQCRPIFALVCSVTHACRRIFDNQE